MRAWLVLGVIACFLLAGLSGGLAPFGRVALALGLPGLAAEFMADPYWRGVAHYRGGDFDAAAADFAAAGPRGLYDLGNAEVRRGNYAAALEAYDLALFGGPDPSARANFDLVRAFYASTALEADSIIPRAEREGDTAESFVARGSARGAGTGDEVTNSGTAIDLLELESREQQGVRRVFDDAHIVASPRWLSTLEDVPGVYLAARISAERKRRLAEGTAQEPEDTQW